MLFTLAISHALADEPARAPADPAPTTLAPLYHPDSEGQIVRPQGHAEVPLLVLNGTAHYAQEYASLQAGNVLSSIPGVTATSFAGVPMRDVTVRIDGVTVESAGGWFR